MLVGKHNIFFFFSFVLGIHTYSICLKASACPAYLWVRQPSQVGVEVEVDSDGGSRQGDSSDQQDQ